LEKSFVPQRAGGTLAARHGGAVRANLSPSRNELARQIRQIVIYYAAVTHIEKGTTPMDKAPVEDLASKHAALHALIDEEENRPHPDEELLHRLKKEKLRIKDAMLGH
jgi:hypothetical protein